jgi:hypothetical protein
MEGRVSFLYKEGAKNQNRVAAAAAAADYDGNSLTHSLTHSLHGAEYYLKS